MQPGTVASIAVGVVILVALVWTIATYNRFIGLRQHLKESWADIDVELKRRYDLIPNLVETVKGYAVHERETLESVIALRNAAQANHGPQSSQATDESALLIGLKKLFALAEGYPDLNASTNYLALQKQLALTEDRIAASRRFYNANVRDLNRLRQQFPTSVVGNVFNFEAASFFELDSDAERVVPKVEI
ncbi:MAG: LemA family protein [Planctomycetota bacterium]